MFNFPLQAKHWAGPLLVLALSLVLFVSEPASSQWLAYDRILIKSHQWWRLLSGNLLHTNANHLLLNGAGLLLLWALHGDYYRPGAYLGLLLGCGLGCGIGLYLFSPEMIWYVGLSGALHGLFVWGGGQDIRLGLRSGWLLMAGVWAKIGYEQWQGPSEEIASLIEASVAVDAHLYGAISGLLILAGQLCRTRFATNKETTYEKEL
ncbi:rhombosortase [Bowmanella dokdonensis]|uniref:Rhombosortase n=1 Tax=Bowmanella dokdonensis TaxID=751969 RepID=A0A939IR66_9ALTE|nr:rhombosortase [Bowmanella dokdonensis]MBN7825181.1 rhombosortase [Bowmanella dokdonensis]